MMTRGYDSSASWLVALVAMAALVALLAPASARAGDGGGSTGAGDAPPQGASVLDDGRSVRFAGADGASACRLTLDDWRAWAQGRFDEAFPEPPRIGDQPKRPGDFDRIGAATRPADGQRAAFTVSTYAILTTLSLVVVVDTQSCAMSLVPAAYQGDVREPTWSPDARTLAFALSTARAAGETLAMLDAVAAEPGFTIGREALLDALEEARPAAIGRAGANAADFTPHVRALAWRGDGAALRFTTDLPGTGGPDAPTESSSLRWRVGAGGEGLEPWLGHPDAPGTDR